MSFAKSDLAKLGVFFFFLVLFFAVAPGSAHATDRYWYPDSTSGTGTGNWSATGATGHWADDAAGLNVGGAVPGTGDNVYFTSTSFTGTGQTVTVGATAYCKDMDWTGATNSPTLTIGGGGYLQVYGNITTIAAMTFNRTDVYYPLAMSNATINITTNGLTWNLPFRNEASFSGTVNLLDNFSSTGDLSFTTGTFNTNNHNVTISHWSAGGSGSKTQNWGSSIISVSASIGFNNSGTNISMPANTATINVTGTGTFAGGEKTYYNVNLNGTAHTISGNNTFNILTRNGTATKTDTLTLTSGTTITATTFAMVGNSATNRLLVQSSTLGSPATITATNWTGSQNVDLMDITATNAIDLSAITGLSGDAGGNTGITFTTSAAQTWTPTLGTNWSTAANWTSRVPLPQDDVTAGGTGNTITVDMPRIGKSITFTGTPVVSVSNTIENYGSFTLVSGMTYTPNSKGNYLRGRSVGMPVDGWALTTAGKTIYQIVLYAPTGIYSLQDTLTLSVLSAFDSGTFTTNNYNINSSSQIKHSAGMVATWNLGSSIITLTATVAGVSWRMLGTGLTLNAGTSTIIITNATANALTFESDGLTYNNVTVQGAGNYALTITGSNTFNTFTVDRSQAAKALTFTAGTTQTFTNFVAATSGTNALTINSDTTGTHALVKSGGGTISSDYLNIQHSVATPAYTWYAGTNSTNNQSVATAGSGWTFTAVPGSSYKTLVGKGVDSYQVMTDGSNIYGYLNVVNVVSTPISGTAWHHVVMTYDGATQKIYVDGVLQSSGSVTGAINTNSSNVEIGQNFAGKIDNVRVYNRALSQAEILAANESYNPSVQISDLQKGLVGHWRMDGNAKDSTANSNHGTITGAILTTDRKGEANKAYSFNGSSNYVDVGNGASLNFIAGQDFSVGFWMKTNGSCGPPIFKRVSSGQNEGYQFTPTGAFVIDVTAGQISLTPVSTVTNGVWHHLVGLRKGTTAQLFVDGNLEKSTTDAIVDDSVSTAQPLWLGKQLSDWADPDYFNGLMDDVRIYSRALSATEVTALYNEYNPGIAVSDLQKGLVGQWKFDGNAKDSTANSNHGTVTGAILTTDRKGQVNKAYSFDKVDDIISLGQPASLANVFSNGGTLEAWIKPNSMGEGDYGRIVAKADGSHIGWVSSTRGESGGYMQVGLTIYTSGTAGTWRTTNTVVPVGAWTHFVVTYNSSQLATDAIIYINGQSVAVTETSTPTGTYGSDTNTNANIGNEPDYSRTFDGSLDDVRIYNRALSAAEVTALYENY